MAEDEAQRLHEEVNNLYEEGKYQEALDACDKALAIDPKDVRAWAVRGSVMGIMERYQEALESYDKALAIDPKGMPACWNARGMALDSLGRYMEALESFDKALAIDPKDAEAWADRSFTLNQLNCHQEALDSCDRAIAIDSKFAPAWDCRGNTLFHLGRYQEAVESFDKVIAIDPKLALTWAYRGSVLFLLGRYQEAVESYEKSLEQNPDLKQAWELKQQALDKLEEWLKARRPPSPYIELYGLVAATEKRLHLFVCQRLRNIYRGSEDEWWVKGVPLHVRQKCAQRREEDPRREPAYNYTDLIDLKEIADRQWRHFEADFQRVKGRVKSKKELLDGLARLNEIRKIVMHPVRSLPTGDDFVFARHMQEVIESFTSTE